MTGRKITLDVRIILALVGKDLTDLIRNKGLLTTLGTVAFLMVFYQVMPLLGSTRTVFDAVLYDPGQSGLATQLENIDGFDLRIADSVEELERYIGSESDPVLGVIVPADYQWETSTEAGIQLEAMLDHWVSDSAVDEIQGLFEAESSRLLGKSVSLRVEHNAVLTHPDGWKAFMSSLSLLVMVTVLGLLITPGMMLEEKESKTLNALLTSPAGPSQIVLGKALSTLLLCLAGAGVWLIFGAPLVTHWGILMIALPLGALFSVSLGLLLGILLDVKQQVSLWSFVLIQPLLLGPVFSYLDLLPDRIRSALLWIPTSGLTRTLRLCFSAKAPYSTTSRDLAVLAGATILVLGVVTLIIRRRDR